MKKCHQSHGLQSKGKIMSFLPCFIWVTAVALFAFLLLWPVCAGMVSCGEDIDYSRGAAVRGSLINNISFWWASRQFRPVDIASRYFVDNETLSARWVFLLHLPAVIGILAAIRGALKRLSAPRVCFPLAVIIWCLHVSTTVALWQHDTIAQTWVAACGLWLGLLVWDTITKVWEDKPVIKEIISLVLLTILGVLTKEVFFGVVAVMDFLLVGVAFAAFRNGKTRIILTILNVMIVMTTIPFIFFLVRWFCGLHAVANGNSEGRYHLQLGINVIYNMVLGLICYFEVGPTHVLQNPLAPTLLRIMPLVATGTTLMICIAPWYLAWKAKCWWLNRPNCKTIVIIGTVTYFGILATLPMSRISELYLLGPNAGLAVIAAISLVGWCECVSYHIKSRLYKTLPIVASILVFCVGIYGLASRSDNFHMTWMYAVKLDSLIRGYQNRQLPDENRVGTIYIPSKCTNGYAFSQYYCLPANCIALNKTTVDWYNQQDPTRKIRIVCGDPPNPVDPNDYVLDTTQFSPRRNW